MGSNGDDHQVLKHLDESINHFDDKNSRNEQLDAENQRTNSEEKRSAVIDALSTEFNLSSPRPKG